MQRLFILLLIVIGTGHLLLAQSIQYFSLDNVELLPSPFQHAQELDKQYLLEMEADRLLAPYLREAGLEPKAESYSNWENTGLDGHIGGHYVSALAMMYASTGDEAIKDRLDYMLSEWKRCQDASGNGYLGGIPGGQAMWAEIKAGNIRAGAFSLNDKWVPLYNIHKVYAGLRDAYWHAGSEAAREMLISLTDWAIDLTADLSDEQIQNMLRSEHGGLNEVFADVAEITGEEKYLVLARRFSHQVILDPLLAGEDDLTGKHANTQIPKVIGYKRIADLSGEEDWSDAAEFFWETVVEDRSVVIGGNSAYEHFHPETDFTRMIHAEQGPETCNTYNMMRLTRMFFQSSQEPKFIDYYEQALYNHILSSQHPETGGLVYFTQMRPGHYRVYSQPHTSFWCCVGSGIENHAKYGEMIYAHEEEAVFVNLFLPSKLNWEEKGVEIVQETSFPQESQTTLTINPAKRTRFALKIRKPQWISGTMEVSINGSVYSLPLDGEGYLNIERKWKKGDQVIVQLPMELSTVQLPDGSPYYAYIYGPIVLAAKYSTENMPGLFADDSRGGHIAHGQIIPMRDMPIIVGDSNELLEKATPIPGKPLTFHLEGLQPEEYAEGMELIPFYQLHEARYILYWQQATEAELVQRQAEIEEQERARLRLETISVDKIASGEQQPESDHFVESQDSWTGFSLESQWREASGWFSYQMRNPAQDAEYLYVRYYNLDLARAFEVFVDGESVAVIQADGDSGDEGQIAMIPIPASAQNNETLTVKIAAKEWKWTPKITEVRLLSGTLEE